MNRWFHPTRTCPKHGTQLLVTRSGVVFCADGLDANKNPTCNVAQDEVRIPKAVRRAMQRVRKRTVKKLRKLIAEARDPNTELGAAVAYFKQKNEG